MKIGTANLGGGPAKKVFADLLHLMGLADVLVLQEAGDRHSAIKEACRRMGWDYYLGTGGGRCVIVWRKELKVHRRMTIPVSPRTDTGQPSKGRDPAGPRVLHAEHVTTVRFTGFGWVASQHLPASQWWPPRRRLALRETKAMAAWARLRIHVVIGGDWNCGPNARVLRPLKKAGLTTTQRAWAVATHGRRRIDAFFYKGVRCFDVQAIETSSDHDALIGVFRRKDKK